MYFGAGSLAPRLWNVKCSDSAFPPLVSLDVVAHELTHGVTEYNSDLTYCEAFEIDIPGGAGVLGGARAARPAGLVWGARARVQRPGSRGARAAQSRDLAGRWIRGKRSHCGTIAPAPCTRAQRCRLAASTRPCQVSATCAAGSLLF